MPNAGGSDDARNQNVAVEMGRAEKFLALACSKDAVLAGVCAPESANRRAALEQLEGSLKSTFDDLSQSSSRARLRALGCARQVWLDDLQRTHGDATGVTLEARKREARVVFVAGAAGATGRKRQASLAELAARGGAFSSDELDKIRHLADATVGLPSSPLRQVPGGVRALLGATPNLALAKFALETCAAAGHFVAYVSDGPLTEKRTQMSVKLLQSGTRLALLALCPSGGAARSSAWLVHSERSPQQSDALAAVAIAELEAANLSLTLPELKRAAWYHNTKGMGFFALRAGVAALSRVSPGSFKLGESRCAPNPPEIGRRALNGAAVFALHLLAPLLAAQPAADDEPSANVASEDDARASLEAVLSGDAAQAAIDAHYATLGRWARCVAGAPGSSDGHGDA
ncbi:hypothetical protein KFE25_004290 [Diacronema lutheri]|uniref:Uncharacterized protein n=2 Tax=Diacronema lutheri TaxID=2081491 RepID=A0A8J5X5P2_DIALT|nr:hypothetical protein KFE25_004290 [Diacronema lutheri]